MKRVLFGIMFGAIIGVPFAYFITKPDAFISRYVFDALKRNYAVQGGGLASIADVISRQDSEITLAQSERITDPILLPASSSTEGFVTEETFIPGNTFVTAVVRRVIDGDTIELENGDYVRYIGVNTPEVVAPGKPIECYGSESRVQNKTLIEGRTVRLEGDTNDRDQYQRLLRYVYLQNATSELFINLELVRLGYAYASAYPPDTKYMRDFSEAEHEAKASSRGLWGACE